MRPEKAMFTGTKGYYSIEFIDEDGAVAAKAWGPIPFQGAGWTSMVATATAQTVEDALRLLVEKLESTGA